MSAHDDWRRVRSRVDTYFDGHPSDLTWLALVGAVASWVVIAILLKAWLA